MPARLLLARAEPAAAARSSQGMPSAASSSSWIRSVPSLHMEAGWPRSAFRRIAARQPALVLSEAMSVLQSGHVAASSNDTMNVSRRAGPENSRKCASGCTF